MRFATDFIPKTKCKFAFKSNFCRAPKEHPRRKSCILVGTVAELGTLPLELTNQRGVELPPKLRDAVAVLQAGNLDSPDGLTNVYILGISHVSKTSVEQVKELIKLVQPDVVAVELCKSRLGLLVDMAENKKARETWHCRKFLIEGLPETAGWPTSTDLLPLLRCRPSTPITTAIIEDDVSTLLKTGLFKTVKPKAENPGAREAPAFLTGPAGLLFVPPLGSVTFMAEPRMLPPIVKLAVRIDSSLKGVPTPPQETLDSVCAAAVTASAATEGPATVNALLNLRVQLAAEFGRAAASGNGNGSAPVVVTFSGEETGKIEVLVKAARASDPAYISGLESSAIGGNGLGIEPFRFSKPLFKLGPKMFLPMEFIDQWQAAANMAAVTADSETGERSSGSSGAGPSAGPWASVREWTRAEMDTIPESDITPQPVADSLSSLLTSFYSRFQAVAGRVVGVETGEAWRAALEGVAGVRGSALVLIDRPTDVTDRRFADALLESSNSRIVGSLLSIIGSFAATFVTDAPALNEAAYVAGGFAAAALLLEPIISPLLRVSALSQMTAEEIERAVTPKEPVQPAASGPLPPLKLWGEDALLDWPGADGPLLKERDSFMATSLAAIASGRSPGTPAFVSNALESGTSLWRYVVPEQAPVRSAPSGLGDGVFSVSQVPRNVVAVVGTAHVRGMCEKWQSTNEIELESLLKI